MRSSVERAAVDNGGSANDARACSAFVAHRHFEELDAQGPGCCIQSDEIGAVASSRGIEQLTVVRAQVNRLRELSLGCRHGVNLYRRTDLYRRKRPGTAGRGYDPAGPGTGLGWLT